MRKLHPAIKSVSFAPAAPLRLWKVSGNSRTGNPVTLKLRASDHDHALERARERGVTATSCVLMAARAGEGR